MAQDAYDLDGWLRSVCSDEPAVLAELERNLAAFRENAERCEPEEDIRPLVEEAENRTRNLLSAFARSETEAVIFEREHLQILLGELRYRCSDD